MTKVSSTKSKWSSAGQRAKMKQIKLKIRHLGRRKHNAKKKKTQRDREREKKGKKLTRWNAAMQSKQLVL